MPQDDPYGFHNDQSALEAAVSPSRATTFEERYREATGEVVSPGNPPEYQSQPNKWGAECRIYFNSPHVAEQAEGMGLHVEEGRPYKNAYRYRINNQELWWDLVESYGFRLGVN